MSRRNPRQVRDFPSFSEGLSLRAASFNTQRAAAERNFPSFSEGLSLRVTSTERIQGDGADFPSFSEGLSLRTHPHHSTPSGVLTFPFLFGGTFIEGPYTSCPRNLHQHFPSFSEGLSLRAKSRSVDANLPMPKFPFLFGETFIEGRVRPGGI